MTIDAQSALRTIMEKYSKVTRFCIICNYISKIMDPIASRCTKFRFNPICLESMAKRIEFICENEKIEYTPDISNILYKISSGDLRKAITILQSAYSFSGSKLNIDSISFVSGFIPKTFIENIWKTILFKSLNDIEFCLKNLLCEGFSSQQILSQFFDYLMETKELNINDENLSKILLKISYIEENLRN